MEIDKKYLDIIRTNGCWGACQLASAFASDTTDIVDYSYQNTEGEQETMKISPDKEMARLLYQIILERAMNAPNLIDIGDSISENLKDKVWVEEIYRKAIDQCNTTTDMLRLPETLTNEYGEFKDQKWAKEIILLALDLCVDFHDYTSVVDEIYNSINDTKWALEVLKTAESFARTSHDYKELGAFYSGGYGVRGEKMDPIDIEKARDFFKIAVKKVEMNYDINEIIRNVSENLKDKKWAKEICKDHLETLRTKGFDRMPCSHLVSLANLVNENLNDRGFSKEIYIQALEESKNNTEDIDYIIRDVENEWGYNDKELAQKLNNKYNK